MTDYSILGWMIAEDMFVHWTGHRDIPFIFVIVVILIFFFYGAKLLYILNTIINFIRAGLKRLI